MSQNGTVRLGGLVDVAKGRRMPEAGLLEVDEHCTAYLQIDDLRPDASPKFTRATDGIRVTPQDIVIAWDGANAGTVSYGLTGFIGSTLARLRMRKQGVDTTYLGRFLQSRSQVIRDNCTGATVPHVNRRYLESLEVPLPPLPEQKQIASILDKADAIRRKRRQTLTATDGLLCSWFMRTVGPDAVGYDSWSTRTVEELARKRPGSMRTGPFGSDLKHSEFVDEGVAVLGIDNAVHNRFAWSGRRYITEEKYKHLRRYQVFPGDVIVTIMGTVGRSAVVPRNIPTAINTKHLACITLDHEAAEPEFLSQAFQRHPEVLKQLGSASRGAIMTGLNLGIIKTLRFPVPPVAVQRRFAEGVAAIRNTEESLLTAACESDSLFSSLVGQAFRDA